MSKTLSLDQRIKNLVETEFENMTFSKTFSNQAKLFNKCQKVIRTEWGISNEYIWNKINEQVTRLIPDEMD